MFLGQGSSYKVSSMVFKNSVNWMNHVNVADYSAYKKFRSSSEDIFCFALI